ncbi:fibronectin type III domain-containing protein-like isoform X2 [Montipora foliosa]|uniref:fibronectin type III domain-containing protein-like isoform X2 n=1 Tax=Montipora foliosa TaxID=591990 RepID=UPI0035F10E42
MTQTDQRHLVTGGEERHGRKTDDMQKDFTICLVKCFLFCFSMCFMILKDASSSSGPQCEIICKLSGSAKDEETVDPDSKVPFNCSIRNGGATTQHMTWKELYQTVTAPADGQPCMVLKTGNSERQIYLARALTVALSGTPKTIYENIGKNLSCEFEGRPRPFITWYVDGKSIMSEFKELSHTELETSQDDGIFKVTSTLYIPGREKFHALSFTCSGTNNLTSGWSSSANETISVRFKYASSASGPQCEIICKLSGSAKDEETVDPDSKVPFNCSIGNRGATTQNTTWKQLYRTVTAPADGLPCMVLKTGNSERQIYLARALTVAKPGSPKIIYENIGTNLSCKFEGRPRPFITWYVDGKSIMSEFEELSHTELETLQDDGIFKVTSTLYIPGRKKFNGRSFTCSGTNNLASGWSSSASETISVRFKCKDFIKAIGPPQIEVNAFNNITLRCLVSRTAAIWCQGGFTWHFNKNPEPLKTDGKYVIVKFEKIKSVCKKAFNLEILNVTEDDEGEYSCHQRCSTFAGWHSQSGSIKMKVYSPHATPEISTTNEVNDSTTSASIPELTTVGRTFNTPQATSSEKWILATVIPIVGVLVFVLLAVTWRIKKKRPYYHKDIIFPKIFSRRLEVTEENAF